MDHSEDHLWIEVEGDENAVLGIGLYHEFVKLRAKHFLGELAEDGAKILASNVPQYGTSDYSTGYTWRHVDHTDVEWLAGPGEFSATVGVKAGTSYHPVYANRGTGIYGPHTPAAYTTKPPGGLMWFYASRLGKRIGRKSVKGQRAQRFLYITFKDLQMFAEARIVTKNFL